MFDSCFDFLGKKCFHRLSLTGIFVFTFFGTIIWGVLLYYEATESEKFRCYEADKKTSDIIRDGCYDGYNKQFNRNFPLYGFTLLVFCSVLSVCVVYSQYVRLQVENEINSTGNSPVRGCKVFTAYFAHLITRSILMIVGLVLQWGVIYPISFPEGFSCRSDRANNKNNSTENPANNASTTTISDYHCKNPPARTKTIFAILLFATTALFLGLSLVELVCLLPKAKTVDFTSNEIFSRKYLNNIQGGPDPTPLPKLSNMENNQASLTQTTQVFQEPILIAEEEQVVHDAQPILNIEMDNNQASLTRRTQAFREGLCQRIENGTKEIRSPIPATLSDLSNEVSKKRNLDEVFVNLSIQHGIAKQSFCKIDERIKILDSYYPDKSDTFHKPMDIFCSNKDSKDTLDSPRIVLAVGRPGIGKSCLARKVVREWAKDKQTTTLAEQIEDTENTNENGDRAENAEEFTRRINFVFAFEFRRLNQWPSVSLEELVKRSLYSENLDDDEVLKDILSKPREILFVFDGLDEAKNIDNDIQKEKNGVYDQNNKKMPIGVLFAKLVLGKLVRGATIFTTTRSNALTNAMIDLLYDNVNKKDRRVVEILGFTTDKVNEFIDKFVPDENIRGQVKIHLKQNGNLLSLCYIPVNCFIVCYAVIDKITQNSRETPSKLPNTLTEIYEFALNRFVLNHHDIYKSGVKVSREKEHDNYEFRKSVNETLQKLGQIAKKGLEDGKLIFSKKDISGVGNEATCVSDQTLDRLVKSGLLYPVPNSEGKSEEEYCFVHLTFQEFLAARVIADGNLDEIAALTTSVVTEEGSKMKLVHRFVAGLLKRSDKVAENINRLLNPLIARCRDEQCFNGPNFFQLAHCLFEFNNEEKVKSCKLRDNNIMANGVTDADCGALVFFCKHFKGMNINVSESFIGPPGCAQLAKLVKDGNIKDLNITHNKIGRKGAQHLLEAIESGQCQVDTLNLSYNKLTDIGVNYVTKALKSKSCKLRSIKLAFCFVNDDHMKDFKDALIMPTSNLNKLDLLGNKITSLGAKYLKEAMESEHCQLEELELSNNALGDKSVKYLCEALVNNNCKLRYLDIKRVGLTCDGGKHVAEVLKSSQCKLKKLLVSVNDCTHPCTPITYFIEALDSDDCQLDYLDISDSILTRLDAKKLTKNFRSRFTYRPEDTCDFEKKFESDSRLIEHLYGRPRRIVVLGRDLREINFHRQDVHPATIDKERYPKTCTLRII